MRKRLAALVAASMGLTACDAAQNPGQETTTKGSFGSDGCREAPTDVPRLSALPSEKRILASPMFSKVLYSNLGGLVGGMAESGAFGVNASWEEGRRSSWYIGEQKRGADAVIGGLLTRDPPVVNAGLKMMEWGFSHQAEDGSFRGSGDVWHSASMFVASVAQGLSYLKNSRAYSTYKKRVDAMLPKLADAALWLAKNPNWSRGLRGNKPYTHRRYVVALAMALTAKVTGEHEKFLMEKARRQIREGIALQKCGLNPELSGHDTSYQAVGLWYAGILLSHFPREDFSKDLWIMMKRGMDWQLDKISSCGRVDTKGNTRTGPNATDVGRSGKPKDVDYNKAIRAFLYFHHLSGDDDGPWRKTAYRLAWYRGWYNPQSSTGCQSKYRE